MRTPSALAKVAIGACITLGALTPLVSVSGCSTRNGDIDRVVDPYWDKAYFSSDDVWYYRATVIDSAPGTSPWFLDTIASGHSILIERLRWEITEHHLIGYRDYASAPGTEDDQWAGAEDVYRGQVVAMYPIMGHFDRRRTYDPGTGEETNEIVENMERPWFDRLYFRVDWTRNLAPTLNFPVKLHQMSGQSFAVQANDVGDPKRWRFEDGYFETVSRGAFEPDIASLVGLNGPGYVWDGAAMVLDVRHSFFKVDPSADADYQITHNPPSVVLEDEDGKEVRGEDGFAVRVPVSDRFGLFSTWGRNYWDEDRGFTSSGKQWHATLFDIWERSTRDDGSVIPIADREPKPIRYYTNVTHPKELLTASIERVGGQWNRAFQEVVYYAQPGRYASIDDVPAMFIVQENDCNVENVRQAVEKLDDETRAQVAAAAVKSSRDGDTDGVDDETGFDGTIDHIKARYDAANDPGSDAAFHTRSTMEHQALEDLERVCSALEYFTDPRVMGNPEAERFTYQRFGDVRYSMLNLVFQDVNSGWLGLGPPFADPINGRTISANANIAVDILDGAVERYNQMVDTLNGNVPFGDLIYGFDVQAYMAKKLADSQALTSFRSSSELREAMRKRLGELGPASEALRDMPPTAPAERRSRIAGTRLEQRMIHPQDAALIGAASAEVLQGGDLAFDDQMLELLSPARGREKLSAWAKDERVQQLGYFGIDTPELLDGFAFGLAVELKDIADREERRRRLREDFYVAVQLHEVGHNVGLMHNFEASSDAMNYGPRFWELQALPADIEDAMGVVESTEDLLQLDRCVAERARLQQEYGLAADFTTQECLQQTHHMYSSIMDYHGTWNGDFGGLGGYDRAAVKFGYGHLLEVFPEENFQFTGGHDALRSWTFHEDWRDIPSAVVDGYDAVNAREYIPYEWGPASTNMALPDNAVPFRFCAGGLRSTTPWCQTGDIGPDMRTNAAMNLNRYWQYYFFSHFNRDRMWSWDTGAGLMGALNADQAVMYDYTKKMQWYVFQSLTDPAFPGSYAEEDFLATTVAGLNHLGHVISHPSSGFYINPLQFDVAGLLNDMPDADRLATTDIMVPWTSLFQCEAVSYANLDNLDQPASPKAGHRLTQIELGDGRPFFIGLTEDYEDWYLRYVGTYWAKWDAIDMLGYNFAFFPGTNYEVDPSVFDISWYRLFPSEVESLMYRLIVGDYHELGPVVDANGSYRMRDVIDPTTGEAPDYSGDFKVLPSISYNHQYAALFAAHTSMSSVWDSQRDFLKSFKVSVDGAEDDFGAYDTVMQAAIDNGEDPAEVVSEFVHPSTGERILALRSGEYPVAYELVRRLNVLKARYELLDACVQDESLRATEPYCQCVESVVTTATGARACSAPYLELPGQGECPVYELERRRESAFEVMQDGVDFIDDVRLYNRIFSEW